jgi:predicted metal-dependent phosphotriesterase family hydrolase
MYDERSTFYHRKLDVFLRWIESFRLIVETLLDRGVSQDAVRRMVRDNPAQLLGGP